jgi:CO/xanthine dehydrogenase FAD-binding subunit
LAEDASPDGVRRAADLAAAAAKPIDDIRASAAYRRAMVAVLVRRGIEAVLADSLSSILHLPTSAGAAA